MARFLSLWFHIWPRIFLFLQQNPSNTPVVLAPYSQHRCFRCGVDFDLPNWGRSINSAFDATRVALAKLKKALGTDRAAFASSICLGLLSHADAQRSLSWFFTTPGLFQKMESLGTGMVWNMRSKRLYTLKEKHSLPKYLEDSNSWKPSLPSVFFSQLDIAI